MEKKLIDVTGSVITELYGQEIDVKNINIQKTRSDITGDYTIVVFPFVKMSKKSPDATAHEIGEKIVQHLPEASGYNVIKGFLNIEFADSFWIDFLNTALKEENFGIKKAPTGSAPIVIEYSSPNTNKPLHLGHIRNNLLGFAIANILEADGNTVKKVNLVNDRGIHICKSMLAWQKWGNEETPESSGIKGDHLIGNYYVLFDKKYKEEIKELVDSGVSEDEAKKNAPLIKEAQQMLRLWEQGDDAVVSLWKKMNHWVYEGFEITYKRMGVDFDKIYYESSTYLLGKELVLEGLKHGQFFKKEDGSIWADLTQEGLDEKLLLRNDGTSVYMTQDLGTACLRHDDYMPQEMIYVVGNEQIYHFDVLKKLLIKIGKNWGRQITHLSYGMVELPEGKMKSREGTVVDADDLMDEMFNTAKETTTTLGKASQLSEEQANTLFHQVGMGALKYYILKVDPKKTMTFNPKESIDFNGNTGPFIQYTYARICSIISKSQEMNIPLDSPISISTLEAKEKALIKRLYEFPLTISMAAENYSPAVIANYIYDLAKEFNQFYHDFPILKAEDLQQKTFRVNLSAFTAQVIKTGMQLLGITVPTKM